MPLLAPFDELLRDLADPAERARLTQAGLDCASAVRQTIGPDRDLLIDAHSRFALDEGLDLAGRFEPLKLFWLEEVTEAKPLSDLATINKQAAMPTAGGDYSRRSRFLSLYHRRRCRHRDAHVKRAACWS